MGLDVGIVGYATTTPGVGGTIKATPEDFVVEEISAPPPPFPGGRYSIATVRVRNWETNRLVREMARALRISRRRIGYAGTKDKRAVTTQLVSFEDVPPEALRAMLLGDVEVLDVYPAAAPLELGGLQGNRFRVVVRNLSVAPEEAAHRVYEVARELRRLGGFPSFFGIQRFGSVRPITHIVGRHIVRGEFEEAVNAYVANPLEGEDATSYEVRSALRDSGDVRAALRAFPNSYAFEKAILNHLATDPGDFVGALRVLPFNLQMMFVHGYQSFLFNRILSERMRRGLPIHEPVAGDLVLPADSAGLPDRSRTIDVSGDNLDRVTERCREGKAWVGGLLFGCESEFAAGEPGQIEKSIIASEGLRPDDFLIPEIPRISSKGTRREILAPFRGLEAAVQGANLALTFDLTRGSYATSLIREFTKSG
jgi:tRNA pseudouridine13 synthase